MARWWSSLHDSEFTKSVNSHQHHDTNDQEIDKLFSLSAIALFLSVHAIDSYQRSWSSAEESTSRTNEETGTNGATDGNHLHVSVLELPVQWAHTLGVWRVLVLDIKVMVVAIIVVSWGVGLHVVVEALLLLVVVLTTIHLHCDVCVIRGEIVE